MTTRSKGAVTFDGVPPKLERPRGVGRLDRETRFASGKRIYGPNRQEMAAMRERMQAAKV